MALDGEIAFIAYFEPWDAKSSNGKLSFFGK
jgi:hypothetical protein